LFTINRMKAFKFKSHSQFQGILQWNFTPFFGLVLKVFEPNYMTNKFNLSKSQNVSSFILHKRLFLTDKSLIISKSWRAGKNPSTQSWSTAQNEWKIVEFSSRKETKSFFVGLCYSTCFTLLDFNHNFNRKLMLIFKVS
jgi:hypothetical protein